MSFQCYTPRTSLRANINGGMFILADGTRRFIPDHWLTQAELIKGSCLVRLTYTFCMIEISGQLLDPIFEDATANKLGAVQAAPAPAGTSEQLRVTNIVVMTPAAHSEPSFEQECSDA